MTSHKRKKLWRGGLAASAATLLTVGAFLAAPTASANIGGPLLPTTGVIGNGNTSDPFIMTCTNNGTAGFCLYTSQDMVNPPPRPTIPGVDHKNSFSMRDTLGFFSTTGWANSWVPMSNPIFTENNIPWRDPGAYHAWAPAAYQWSDGTVNLFVPDVTVGGHPTTGPWPGLSYHNTSRIALASGPGPLGPFTYDAFITATDQAGNPWTQTVGGQVIQKYMSDPEPFEDETGRFLLWANGDGQTCGTLSGGRVPLDWAHVTETRDIQVTGWPTTWGKCTKHAEFGGGTVNTPYLEGPSLFKFSDEGGELQGFPGEPYTLLVPAKPTVVPTECSSAGGGTNTALSALTWATSTDPLGPFTYRGIVMCGSTTEWTNHATIGQLTTSGGNKRAVLFYHDGPGNTQRQVHAECLYFTSNGYSLIPSSRSASFFTGCMNESQKGVALRMPSRPGGIVSAPSSGNANLTPNRYAVGDWERLVIEPQPDGTVALKMAVNNKYVSTASGNLIANRSSVGNTEKFTRDFNRDGTFALKALSNNRYVRYQPNGALLADSSSWPGPSGTFEILRMGGDTVT